MATGLNSISREKFQLFKGRPELWTREVGREIREEIENVIKEMPTGSLLEIDATGVEVFDYSFASELFVKLVLHLPIEHQGKCIAVKGLDPYPEENLDPALKSAGVMMLVDDENESWHLIGKFSGADQTTLETLSRMVGPVSVQDLADQLEIQPTACSERLSKLTQFGMVHRLASGSGRVQYLYSSIV